MLRQDGDAFEYSMIEPYVIVWDLDGTLGEFSALEGNCDADEPVEISVRPGLSECLMSLSSLGIKHTVLTMASPIYAELALRGAGVRQHFTRVECMGQRRKGDVLGISGDFGIPATAVGDRILFVGDRMPFDEPDHPDVVFHLELCATIRPADRFERLVLLLLDAGQGSFRVGFRKLVATKQRRWLFGWQRKEPAAKPIQLKLRDMDDLLLFERIGACPVIGYEKPPAPPVVIDRRRFIPARA